MDLFSPRHHPSIHGFLGSLSILCCSVPLCLRGKKSGYVSMCILINICSKCKRFRCPGSQVSNALATIIRNLRILPILKVGYPHLVFSRTTADRCCSTRRRKILKEELDLSSVASRDHDRSNAQISRNRISRVFIFDGTLHKLCAWFGVQFSPNKTIFHRFLCVEYYNSIYPAKFSSFEFIVKPVVIVRQLGRHCRGVNFYSNHSGTFFWQPLACLFKSIHKGR
jgi:hypothetical protein